MQGLLLLSAALFVAGVASKEACTGRCTYAFCKDTEELDNDKSCPSSLQRCCNDVTGKACPGSCRWYSCWGNENYDHSKFCDSSQQVCCVKEKVDVVDPGVAAGCGISTAVADGFRVVGGRIAKKGEFPWQAQVKLMKRHYCGATLIADDWIVSAAHCFYGFSKDIYEIVLGNHYKVSLEGTEQIFSLDKVIIHPSYRWGVMGYDIAMVKLNKKVQKNGFVNTACMPDKNESFDGMTCTVSGWGKIENGGASPPALMAADVPMVPLDVCKDAYSKTHVGVVEDHNVCAGPKNGGIDSCHGDSGGPLVCRKKGESWKLVGAVSWGMGCGEKTYYGVYSSIPAFHDWIVETMKKYE